MRERWRATSVLRESAREEPRQQTADERRGLAEVPSQPKVRLLEARRLEQAQTSGGWKIAPLRRQEAVSYDVEASYRRRPVRALPPQVPGSPLDEYPGEQPQCCDEESPRVLRARCVSVRVYRDRHAIRGA